MFIQLVTTSLGKTSSTSVNPYTILQQILSGTLTYGTLALSYIQKYWVIGLVSFIVIFYGWKLFKLLFKWFVALWVSKHLVFMRVILPRSDSRADKEKETKKDFKETLLVMQQLYRALYEIKEINLWNMIRTYILKTDIVCFELHIDKKNLYFYVATLPYYKSIVEKQITTFYPDAEIELTKAPVMYETGYHTKGYYIHTKKAFWNPIKTYQTMEDDPLNDITNVMSKLGEDERAALQMIIRPSNNKWRREAEAKGTLLFKGKKIHESFWGKIPVFGLFFRFLSFLWNNNSFTSTGKTNAPGASGGDSYVRMLQTDEEFAKRVGEKAAQSGAFNVTFRVVAASKEGNNRVDDILNNIVVGFSIFSDGKGNLFQNRRVVPFDFISTPLIYYGYEKRLYGFAVKTCLLTPDELATVYHFPNSIYNKSPVIYWQSYKILPPPIDLPTEGVVLGYSRYRGVKRLVRILRDDRTRHHYVIGKSGSGKSVFLQYMARQDIWNGDGVGVIDPHGDLIEDILCYVPKQRARDVIVFDPADKDRPMGLNILEAKTEEEKDRASLDATEIFIKLYGDEIFGPRIQHYFRNACLTLMDDEDDGATLIDIPRMFTDEEFMKYKVTKIKNSVVKSFWDHEYAHTGAREREEMIPYFSAKFGPFITNTTIRNVIGQSKSAFNIRESMDKQKILLVNLSKGKIGGLNAQLLGLILVNKISMAAMSRVDIPSKDRKDFFLYVDEFQNFATDTFASILSEARKYRLALIMAHQYISQLVTSANGKQSTQVRDAIFGNVGTMMSFKVGAEDAEYLAKEYAPTLSDQDIVNIANYKAYLKLNIHNTTSRPFSLETVNDERDRNEKVAAILKKYSSLKYGRKRVFVDQEIEARIGIGG